MQLTSESQALVVEEALERQIYDGSFECKVYPGGSILTEVQRGEERIFGQVKTQAVIAELRGKHHHAVENFKEDDGGYYFKMQGDCTLKIDAQLQHNWQ
ncbi:hypothetical protein RRG08_028617 [Elysia crispata]|uniref:Uncharacterized protein n=1 Tax=Elysia crispata TaxID=231223 RepID=A0AAE1D2E3_9GAST|nr:hypothetical protein RRG08_028617 [Elysia crispata]